MNIERPLISRFINCAPIIREGNLEEGTDEWGGLPPNPLFVTLNQGTDFHAHRIDAASSSHHKRRFQHPCANCTRPQQAKLNQRPPPRTPPSQRNGASEQSDRGDAPGGRRDAAGRQVEGLCVIDVVGATHLRSPVHQRAPEPQRELQQHKQKGGRGSPCIFHMRERWAETVGCALLPQTGCATGHCAFRGPCASLIPPLFPRFVRAGAQGASLSHRCVRG